MELHSLKISLRYLRKQGLISWISIIGMSIAMLVLIIAIAFAYHEYRFDNFHTKKDLIFRLNEVRTFQGMASQHVSITMYPMGPALKQDYAEVEEYVRLIDADRIDADKRLILGDEIYFPEGAFYTDPQFFKIFDFKLLKGNRETVLNDPGGLVLSEKISKMIFGEVDPLGETVKHGGKTYNVSGIIADIPENSHLQFQLLLPLSSVENENMRNNWGGNWVRTYLLLQENTSAKELESKLRAFCDKYIPSEYAKYYHLYLQPLSQIHLNSSHIQYDLNWMKIDKIYVYFLLIISLAIVFIASTNNINLYIASANRRLKEIGVKKVLGALPGHIQRQWIKETVIITFMALFIGFSISFLGFNFLQELLGRKLVFSISDYLLLFFLLFVLSIGIGIISGLYPSLLSARINTINAIKGIGTASNRFLLGNILIVSQYTIAIVLMVGAIFVFKQFRYMVNKDLGFNKEQVLLIPMDNQTAGKYDLIQTEFLKNAPVSSITASCGQLGSGLGQNIAQYKKEGQILEITSAHLSVDFDFFSFYGLEIVEGKPFSREFQNEDKGKAYLVNETLAKQIDWDSAVGEEFGIVVPGHTLGRIIGVVKDFNFNTLYHEIEPLYFSLRFWPNSVMSVRLKEGDLQAAIKDLEQSWREVMPGYPFQYSFLDQHLNRLYDSDKQFGQVITIFSFLAVFLACLGLFGLSVSSIDKKLKEISIRKVVGASTFHLFYRMIRQLLLMIALATFISAPVAFYLIRNWLNNFAYRAAFDAYYIILVGLLAMLISVFTISFHVWKAATSNPVNILRR